MDKAILVTDMPKSCNECSLYVCYRQWSGDSGDCFCGVNKEDVQPLSKPNWCPLQHVPKKQPHYPVDETFLRGAKTGYNACIDDILKGAEKNE